MEFHHKFVAGAAAVVVTAVVGYTVQLYGPPATSTVVGPAPASTFAGALPSVTTLGPAPTRGLDLGDAPTLAEALPRLELFVEEARGRQFKRQLAVAPLSDKDFAEHLREQNGPASLDPGWDATLDGAAPRPGRLRLQRACARSRTPSSAATTTPRPRACSSAAPCSTRWPSRSSPTSSPTPWTTSTPPWTTCSRAADRDQDGGHPVARRGRRPVGRGPVLPRADRRTPGPGVCGGEVGVRRRTPAPPRCRRCSCSWTAFPYDAGVGLRREPARRGGGPAAVDAAFDNPPMSTLQILEAADDFQHRVDPDDVPEPGTAAGRDDRQRDARRAAPGVRHLGGGRRPAWSSTAG